MQTIQIVFYTAKGNILDKLIRFWTRGTTSHVEFLFGDTLCGSVPFKGTRESKEYVASDYLLFEIDVTEEQFNLIKEFTKKELNCDYDWAGIFLSQIINANHQSETKWFCSEFVLASLLNAGVITGYYIPNRFSPEDLLSLLRYTYVK